MKIQKFKGLNRKIEQKNPAIKVGDLFFYDFKVDGNLIKKFGEIYSESNLLHVDDEFAQKMGFKRRIVYGAFMTSMIIKYIAKTFGNGTILQSHNFKFINPVYAGDTVNLELKIYKIYYNTIKLEVNLNHKDKKVIKGNVTISAQNTTIVS